MHMPLRFRHAAALPVAAMLLLSSACSGPAEQDGAAPADETAATEAEGAETAATFTNPLLPSGPDPWITQADGTYYYTHTLGDRLALWRTDDISDLANAEQKTIWTPPETGPNAHMIWAPELHHLDGKWYMYYSATASGFEDDAHRGVFVLENDSADPFEGEWKDLGQIETEHPGIDGTVFAYDGKTYFAYSPYVGEDSVIALSRMTDPTTLSGEETVIAVPDRPWEKQGGRQILEGPEFLEGPEGDLFLTYSASACWSDDYSLGLLRAPAGSDPLEAKVWTKSAEPVLRQGNGVYATGHNGFFTSPDGEENWIIYHANPEAEMGCTPKRAPHIQKFSWDERGYPVFGEPVGKDTPIPVPSRGDSR